MTPIPTPPRLPWPVRLYRRCLRLYPAAHRARFGDEMLQVFRDQWREAAARASAGPRIVLLLHTAFDLAITASKERWDAAREVLRLPREPEARRRWVWSLGAALPVALVILATTLGLTRAMPKTYRSEARVLVRSILHAPSPSPSGTGAARSPAEAMIQAADFATSLEVLTRVIDRLSLNERLSPEYLGGQGTLHTAETMAILRDRVEIVPYRNTPLLGIAVHDRDRQRAAEVANAIAEACVRLGQGPPNPAAVPEAAPVATTTIIDAAAPALRPFRPNVPLNLLLGGAAAGGAGALTGGMVWWLLRRRPRFPPSNLPA